MENAGPSPAPRPGSSLLTGEHHGNAIPKSKAADWSATEQAGLIPKADLYELATELGLFVLCDREKIART